MEWTNKSMCANSQLKRIFYDTKQAIDDISRCEFINKGELDSILLDPQEENYILNVSSDSPIALIRATTMLRELHARFLRTFVLSAFDLTWDMLVTPKRIEYAKQKELELYNSMMSIANLKQDEIRAMIRETINAIKSDILDQVEIRMHYREEIQEFVLTQLNTSIASKLIASIDSLRNSYVGTLERCLHALEQNCLQNDEPANASVALRQILTAAYRVEVSVKGSTPMLRVLWEKIKQLVPTSLGWHWSHNGNCQNGDQLSGVMGNGNGHASATENHHGHWKRQQAVDIINNLSEWRLAKSICSQFKERLKSSHEQFLQSIKDLEAQHAGRLQHTEELRLKVRKMHAPRMAKYALESTSLIDLILYGMPCLEREIGRGQYGVVYGCESWAGYSPCAVKSVVPPDDKHWYDLAMEFYYTRSVPEHDRIVSIYGSVIDHSYGSGTTPAVLLIMERLTRDLYSAIKSGLDWLSRLQVAIDVVQGIRFLHNQGLVHRDIKLKNVLLDQSNRAKITDLGFCKPEAMMSGSIVGTPIHMSPELFSGRYDNSVDVYAFGILFWYICAGHVRLPHIFEQCQTRDQLWNCVRKGVRPERLPQFDNECWQLMAQCWHGDRFMRPHLGDVEYRLRSIYERYMLSTSTTTTTTSTTTTTTSTLSSAPTTNATTTTTNTNENNNVVVPTTTAANAADTACLDSTGFIGTGSWEETTSVVIIDNE